MLRKLIFAAVLTLYTLRTLSQTIDSVYIDNRDHKEYRLQRIGKTYWFKQNLEYKTENAFSSLNSLTGQVEIFYPSTDVKKACPIGWTIPTPNDWAAAYTDLLIQRKDSNSEYIGKVPVGAEIKLWNDNHFLNLQPVGWIEGSKREMINEITTLWINLDHSRGHLHIRESSFTLHTHHHHLSKIMKYRRRLFSIRCVQSENKQ